MIKDHDEKIAKDRRDFLKLASLGTVVGGATLAAGTAAQASTEEEVKSGGYRETSHIKTYYELSRF